MSTNFDQLKDVLLLTIESSLEAQLRAVRRLRSQDKTEPEPKKEGMSHVDMAYDILNRVSAPLHVSEIIERIDKTFHIKVDRESLVSALTKKVSKGIRFRRTDKNTFGVLKG